MLRSALPLLFVAASAAALVACGSSESTSSTSGNGGSATTPTSTATSAGTGGSATTSTSTATGTSTSTATGTGTLVTNACTNAADTAVLMTKDAKDIAASCGQTNAAAEPATYNCIKMGTGLSDDCASCYDDSVACAAEHCLTLCLSDPASQPCIDCREMYCVPAFQSCSGLDKG
jgi:hypothetical protein